MHPDNLILNGVSDIFILFQYHFYSPVEYSKYLGNRCPAKMPRRMEETAASATQNQAL